MTSLSTRARAALLALLVLGAVGLPSLARADGEPVDVGTQCAGDPPRQTFDPLSPPCVPYWDNQADNGGATYQGVTRDEIRIAVILEGGVDYVNSSDITNRVTPRGGVYDLAESADECRDGGIDDGCDHLTVDGLRVWQEYFNVRYQSFGRFVHLYAVFTSGTDEPKRQLDAETITSLVDPFAAVSLLQPGTDAALTGALHDAGVLTFADHTFVDNVALAASGLAWNFGASAQRAAANYTAFVCKKVVGRPANRAGPALNGRPRMLGMIATDDPNESGRIAAAEAVRTGVEACGGQIVDISTFDDCCYAVDASNVPDQEAEDMARFAQQGVTTVLVAGAMNSNYVRAAQAIGYTPEWMMLGDGVLDNPTAYRFATDLVPNTTIVISTQVVESQLRPSACQQAYREFNFTTAPSELGYVCAYYRPLFLLAMAVQLSGPALTAENLDQGLRSIPTRPSTGRSSPACWFAPGEHACVQDAHLARWDALHTSTLTTRQGWQPGCYLVVDKGRRHLESDWPNGNIDSDWSSGDSCGTYTASAPSRS